MGMRAKTPVIVAVALACVAALVILALWTDSLSLFGAWPAQVKKPTHPDGTLSEAHPGHEDAASQPARGAAGRQELSKSGDPPPVVRVLRQSTGDPVAHLRVSCLATHERVAIPESYQAMKDYFARWAADGRSAQSDMEGHLILPASGHPHRMLMADDAFEFVVAGEALGPQTFATHEHELWVTAGYQVEGRVYGDRSQPLADAVVAAHVGRSESLFGPPKPGVPSPFSPAAWRWAVTDVNGRYALRGIPPSLGLKAIVLHPEHAGAEFTVKKSPAYTHVLADPVRLGRGCTVHVFVRSDGESAAIPHAKVSLRPRSKTPRSTTEPPVATTNEAGVARFRHLAKGKYWIHVSARGFQPLRDRALVKGQPTIECWLQPGAVLAGRVIDSQSREPIVGALVRARSARLEIPMWPERGLRTDKAGRFEFPGVHVHKTTVSAFADGHIQVRDMPATASQGELVIAMDRAAAITGHVVDEQGNPVPKYVVCARTGSKRPRRKSVSDPGGEFRIEGLDTGVYEVEAETEEAHGRLTDVSIAQVTDPESRERIRIVVHPKPMVRGFVQSVDGLALQGVEVRCVVAGAHSLSHSITSLFTKILGARLQRFGVTRTAEDGSFQINIGPRMTALSFRKPWYVTTQYRLEPGTYPSPILVKLVKELVIRGLVKGADGSPVHGAHVVVLAKNGLPRLFTETGANGTFRLGVRSGESHLVRFSSSKKHRTTWSLVRKIAADPQESVQEITAPPCNARLHGRVIYRGKPKIGALVIVTLLGRREDDARKRNFSRLLTRPQRSLATDAGGGFSLAGLMPGAYTVQVQKQKKTVTVGSGDSQYVEIELGSR